MLFFRCLRRCDSLNRIALRSSPRIAPLVPTLGGFFRLLDQHAYDFTRSHPATLGICLKLLGDLYETYKSMTAQSLGGTRTGDCSGGHGSSTTVHFRDAPVTVIRFHIYNG
jgi:hypothetical protein